MAFDFVMQPSADCNIISIISLVSNSKQSDKRNEEFDSITENDSPAPTERTVLKNPLGSLLVILPCRLSDPIDEVLKSSETRNPQQMMSRNN
jgi:hypothetical protein